MQKYVETAEPCRTFSLISHGRKNISFDTFPLTRIYFVKLFSLQQWFFKPFFAPIRVISAL